MLGDGRGTLGFGFVLALSVATAGCASGVASTVRREEPVPFSRQITADDRRSGSAFSYGAIVITTRGTR